MVTVDVACGDSTDRTIAIGMIQSIRNAVVTRSSGLRIVNVEPGRVHLLSDRHGGPPALIALGNVEDRVGQLWVTMLSARGRWALTTATGQCAS